MFEAEGLFFLWKSAWWDVQNLCNVWHKHAVPLPSAGQGVMSVYVCLNALGECVQRSKIVYLWTSVSSDHLRRWSPGAGGRFLITEYIDCRGSARSVGTCREGDIALSLLWIPLHLERLWVDSLFLVQRVVINAPPIRVAVNEPTLWSVQHTSLGFSRRCRVGKWRPLLLAILCTPTHACSATRCTPLLLWSGAEKLDNGLTANIYH